MDIILGLMLFTGLVLAAKSAVDHMVAAYRKSRDEQIKTATKAKGSTLAKPERARVAAQHATGYWARELLHGFPAARLGWHTGWLAHRTAADHRRALREEARTTNLETRAAVLHGLPGHRQRQAEARQLIEQAVAERSTGSPPGDGSGDPAVTPLPAAVGAGTGTPAVPPLPADAVPPPGRPASRADADPPWLQEVGERYQETGEAPAGWTAAGDPVYLNGSQRERDQDPRLRNACAACGRDGTSGDPLIVATTGWRVHQSHTTDPGSGFYGEAATQAPAPATAGAGHHAQGGTQNGAATPATKGAPPVTDTNYDAAITLAQETADRAEEVAATARRHQQAADEYLAAARQRRTAAETAAEQLQALDVDAASLDEWLGLVARLRDTENAAEASSEAAAASEKTATHSAEAAAAVVNGLRRRHGGVAQAVAEAPVPQTAVREFYEGS